MKRKLVCSQCKKEIHRWHEKYHVEADVNRTGIWRKLASMWTTYKIVTNHTYRHADCNQTANVPMIPKGMIAFLSMTVFFIVIAASFLITRQSAVIPIPHIGYFTLYWKDGAYIYGGSAVFSTLIAWHIYEDAN